MRILIDGEIKHHRAKVIPKWPEVDGDVLGRWRPASKDRKGKQDSMAMSKGWTIAVFIRKIGKERGWKEKKITERGRKKRKNINKIRMMNEVESIGKCDQVLAKDDPTIR